jgi:hypothetical protein
MCVRTYYRIGQGSKEIKPWLRTTPRDKERLRFSSGTSRTQWLVTTTVNRSWQITGWRIIEVVQSSRPWLVNRLLWVLSGLPCPWKKLCRNTFWTRLLPESFKAWSLCTLPGFILRNLCLCPRRVQMSRPFFGIIISFFTVESRCVFCEVIPWRMNFSEQIFKKWINTRQNAFRSFLNNCQSANGISGNYGRLVWESYRIDRHTVSKNAAFLSVTAGGK